MECSLLLLFCEMEEKITLETPGHLDLLKRKCLISLQVTQALKKNLEGGDYEKRMRMESKDGVSKENAKPKKIKILISPLTFLSSSSTPRILPLHSTCLYLAGPKFLLNSTCFHE